LKDKLSITPIERSSYLGVAFNSCSILGFYFSSSGINSKSFVFL
jgi:hypothetical protein